MLRLGRRWRSRGWLLPCSLGYSRSSGRGVVDSLESHYEGYSQKGNGRLLTDNISLCKKHPVADTVGVI